MKHLMIPDNLFWVIGRTGRVCGVFVFLLQVGDGSEPISGEGVCVSIRHKGRESVADRRYCGLLDGEHVLKGDRHWQI